MAPEQARARHLWFLFLAVGALLLLGRPARTASPNAHLLATIVAGYLLLWSAVFALRRKSGGTAVKGFLVTSGSLALAIGALEILALAGVDFGRFFETHTGSLWNHPGNTPDPRLFHLRKPHSEIFWEEVWYRYDQHGFRNASDLRAADVVVVGDSFVEGWNVHAGELLTARLAELLGVSVANLGQSGYGSQQELEALRRFGLPLSPRACVWVFFEGNDLGDTARYEWTRKHWRTFTQPSYSERSFVRSAIKALRELPHRNENTPWTRQPGEAVRAANLHRSGLCRSSRGKSGRLYFWYEGRRLSEEDREALRQVGRDLESARRLCAETGAGLLVVFAPSKYRVYRDLCTFAEDAAPARWVLNDLPRQLGTLLAREAPGARYLDLTPVLRAEAASGRLVYFPYDTHWTAAGHAVAAREIAGRLAASPALARNESGR